jgi:spermidine synthase/tetratricopeptide (TPR) repeat protein
VPLAAERVPLALGLLALVIALGTPSWSHRLLDRGPAIYGRDRMDRGQLRSFLRGLGAEQVSFAEGWNAAISVWKNAGATWLKSNGKSDASSVADMDTQVLVGLLPMLAHPNPRRIFVVGFGSGVTVRTMADVPEAERVDVVEIERAVIGAAPFFAEVNRDVLSDPRVRVIEDDARSALQLADAPYDVIASEPTNPWIAGVAALFTRDYFGVVNGRLAEGGVFAQWLQTYRVPMSVIEVVVANLRAVFPHVEMWYANPSDLVLLASRRPIRISQERVARMLEPGAATHAAFRDWLRVDRPSQLLGRFLLGDSGTAALAARARFAHTDNRPSLEFVAARGLFSLVEVRQTFDSLLGLKDAVGDSLPDVGLWALAPGEWEAAYAHALPAESRFAMPMALRARQQATDPGDPAREATIGRVYFERNEFRASLPYLTLALARLPDDPDLLRMAGLATAAQGDLALARSYLERSRQRGGDSVYATSVLAETAVGEGDYRRGAAEAIRALEGLRPTIRTPFPAALQKALERLASLAPPEVAAPVFERALARRPHWDLAYHGGARVYARWGGEHCRRAAELATELLRFGWTDREVVSLLAPCLPRGG